MTQEYKSIFTQICESITGCFGLNDETYSDESELPEGFGESILPDPTIDIDINAAVDE